MSFSVSASVDGDGFRVKDGFSFSSFSFFLFLLHLLRLLRLLRLPLR